MRTRLSAWRRARSSAPLALLLMAAAAVADDGLVQVHEDFSNDPGWEAVNNRVVGKGGPTFHQDFGWSPGETGSAAASRSSTTRGPTTAWVAAP
jgi:hypothetical protein